MEQLVRHRTTAVWGGLVLATLVSWALSAEHAWDSETGRTVATVGILAVAFVKVRFVGLDFMELRRAPLPLRLIFEAWVLSVFTVLAVLYVVGR